MNILENIHKIEKRNWWFMSRRQLVFQLFKKLNFYNNPPNILDIGCGSGANMEMLKPFGKITGIDIFPESVNYVKSLGFKVLEADAQELPLPNNSFDLVLVMDLLEHVENDEKVISEIHRVLKPSGFCIVTVPAFNLMWSPSDKTLKHYRRYSKNKLKKLVKNFIIKKIIYWNFFLFFPILLIRKFFDKYLVRKTIILGDIPNFPNIINKLLSLVLKLENKLIKQGINLPFGVSIVCLLKKR